jgi:hypothetical protein
MRAFRGIAPISLLAAFALLLLCSGPLLAVEAKEMLANPALEARARNLSKELRCMVCQNQSIDDSEAPLAHDLRPLWRIRAATAALGVAHGGSVGPAACRSPYWHSRHDYCRQAPAASCVGSGGGESDCRRRATAVGPPARRLNGPARSRRCTTTWRESSHFHITNF